MTNRYRLFLASLALILGLSAAVPALADNGSQSGGGFFSHIASFFHMGNQDTQKGPNMPGNFIFGQVTAISGNTITVSSKGRPMRPMNNQPATPPVATTYTVDATNATVTKNGAASTVSAIAVGDTIMVQGTVSGTNVTATKINDGMFGRGGFGQGIFGTVTAISGNTLTVTSQRPVMKSDDNNNNTPNTMVATVYTVDATNATVTKNGAASTVSAIAVGDMVSVQGTVTGTNVTATKINDGMLMRPGVGNNPNPLVTGNGEPVIAGSISAISGDSVTVTNKSNVTYTVDVTNATVTKGNTKSTVSALTVGDNVVVQGTVNGTAITAASVIDQGQPASTTGDSGKPKMGFFGSIGSFFKHIFGF